MIKEYGKLPEVECYLGQLNRVFMNLLANAIDALEESNQERSPENIKANLHHRGREFVALAIIMGNSADMI